MNEPKWQVWYRGRFINDGHRPLVALGGRPREKAQEHADRSNAEQNDFEYWIQPATEPVKPATPPADVSQWQVWCRGDNGKVCPIAVFNDCPREKAQAYADRSNAERNGREYWIQPAAAEAVKAKPVEPEPTKPVAKWDAHWRTKDGRSLHAPLGYKLETAKKQADFWSKTNPDSIYWIQLEGTEKALKGWTGPVVWRTHCLLGDGEVHKGSGKHGDRCHAQNEADDVNRGFPRNPCWIQPEPEPSWVAAKPEPPAPKPETLYQVWGFCPNDERTPFKVNEPTTYGVAAPTAKRMARDSREGFTYEAAIA